MDTRVPARISRRAANLSIDRDLLTEARSLDVNISRAAEAGIARAVTEEKSRRWLEESQHAIESSNRYVEQRGLPLERYRQF